jgi:hypothetical protein
LGTVAGLLPLAPVADPPAVDEPIGVLPAAFVGFVPFEAFTAFVAFTGFATFVVALAPFVPFKAFVAFAGVAAFAVALEALVAFAGLLVFTVVFAVFAVFAVVAFFAPFAAFAVFATGVRVADAVEPRLAAVDFSAGDFVAAARRVVDPAPASRLGVFLAAVAGLPLVDPLDARLPAAGRRAVLRGLLVAIVTVSGVPPPCSGDHFDNIYRMQDR